jgi:hypothetical protein
MKRKKKRSVSRRVGCFLFVNLHFRPLKYFVDFSRQRALTLSNVFFTLAKFVFALGARACNASASNPVLILIPAWDGGLEVFSILE